MRAKSGSMTEEKETAPVSEVVVEQKVETESQQRMVPLEALEAERKRRQEAELQIRLKEELEKKAKEIEPEDGDELVNRNELRQFHQKLTREELAVLKREIAEETFKDTQPDAIKAINTHLKEILEKRPWLAESISNAPNRYARAYEIVTDYVPQLTAKKSVVTDAKKIIENAQKPGSPAGVGKSGQLSGSDYLKSIAGTKEFREYRKQLLGR